MRIVSLLPSATELLFSIGGGGLLVGRSHECDHPPAVAPLPVLTAQRTGAVSSAEIDEQVRDFSGRRESLYTLDENLLRDLRPDVILTQDLCEVCSIDLDTVREVAAKMTPSPDIVSLNPGSMEEILDDLLKIGAAVNLETGARECLVALRERYWSARDFVNPYLEGPEVAFLEWMDPLYVGGHWTPQLIREAGGRHSLNPPGAKSKRIDPATLVAARPERVIVCPCGYSLADVRAHLHELTERPWWRDLPAVRASEPDRVVLVDGSSWFNRPGPRLVDAFVWLVGWLNDVPALTHAHSTGDMPTELVAAP